VAEGDANDTATQVEPTPLLEPRDGVPPVIETQQALEEYAAALAAGTGPVAVDAERASGFRYGQRAYLVQLRREGAGTGLVDPVAVPDLTPLADALAGTEWVLHAASQDLPCLTELGLHADRVFDTELAGRILGRDRVGLGAMATSELGLSLAKEHSAADWSTRPLPEAWLRYAALDVEILVRLRDVLERELRASGKLAWAEQEFEATRLAPPPAPKIDPWRRVTGVSRLREARRLAIARELWLARDALGRERDISPGRVLPDRAILAAAEAAPRTEQGLGSLPEFRGRGTRARLAYWWKAVERALALPESELPPRRAPHPSGPPNPRSWLPRFPEAAERLRAVRARMRLLADEVGTPQENLLSPDLQRRLAWEPPNPVDDASVEAALLAAGARPWQAGLAAGPLAAALLDPASVPDGPTGTDAP